MFLLQSALCDIVAVDLSFNNIETIEGLSSLTSLTDLSLSHNRIRKLEGLDSLVNLLVLSIGHNALESMEEVSTLAYVCISRLPNDFDFKYFFQTNLQTIIQFKSQ